MKRILFLILSIVLCVPLVAYAHPGRTDSNGGHTNRSTGEYHYHHGYSAHDHYDMDGDGDIDCPFDFNKAESNSGSSSNLNSKNSGTKIDGFLKKKIEQQKQAEAERAAIETASIFQEEKMKETFVFPWTKYIFKMPLEVAIVVASVVIIWIVALMIKNAKLKKKIKELQKKINSFESRNLWY